MKKIYVLFSIFVLTGFLSSNYSFGIEIGTDKTVGSSAVSAKDQQVLYCSGQDKFLIVWTGNESGKDQIFYNFQTETSLSGTPLTSGILLSSTIDATFRYAEKPQISYDESTGKAAVVWLESNEEGKDSVIMKIIDVAATSESSEIVVASGSTWNMSAAVADNNAGDFLVAYYDTTGNDITAKFFDSSGNVTLDSVKLGIVAGGYVLPNSIDIAYNSKDGLYLVTWADVLTNLFSITLDTLGNKGTLKDYTGITSVANPAIAFNDSSNQFLIVYDDFNGNVRGQLTDSVGNLENIELEFANSSNPVKGGFPDVVFNSTNRNFAISWQNYLSGNGIWIQEYNSDLCNQLSDSVQISSSISSNSPALAYGSVDENYWVVWSGGTGLKDEIVAQRYETDFGNLNAVCKDITVYLDENGAFLLHPDSIDAGSTVPCGSFTLAISKENLSCDDIPFVSIDLIITDEFGATDTCEATVTVIDTISPTVDCKDITVYLDANGTAAITSDSINGGSTDNCSLGTLLVSQTLFSCADIGDNTVTLTVPDTNGNSSTCDAIVTVVDTIPPTLVCKDDTIYINDAGLAPYNALVDGTVVERGDNCTIQGGVGVTGPRNYTCDQLGDHTVTIYQSDLSGNQTSSTITLTVLDTIRPVMFCKNIFLLIDETGIATIVPTDIDDGSFDNCSGVTLSVSQTEFTCDDINNPGANRVVLYAEDASGNIDSCSSVVTVVSLPNAICKDITVYLDENGEVTIEPEEIDNGSFDHCGPVELSITTRSTFTCDDIGATNLVTLSVMNARGDVSTCNSVVTVLDEIPPTIICKDDYVLTLDASGQADMALKLNEIVTSVSDNCTDFGTTVTVGVTGPRYYTCDNAGDNTITIFLDDEYGNKGSTVFNFKVVDSYGIAPTAVCQNIEVELDATGNALIDAAQLDGGSTDDCGAVTFEASKTIFTCDDIGANTVTLYVTDAGGLTSTCVATVTVTDPALPTAVCKNIEVELDATGNASIDAAELDGGSSDACGAITFSASQSEFTCDDIGLNTVTLTVTDAGGLTSTCAATVTVTDPVLPTAVCQNITVQLNEAGNASILVTDIDDGSYDNCGIASLSITPASFTSANIGPNNVTLTVADASGNSSTCTAVVTVEDNLAPEVQCNSIDVYLDNDGQYILTANDIQNLSAGTTDNSDAYADLRIFARSQAFYCDDVGEAKVDLVVEDLSGNRGYCRTVVNVIDTSSLQINEVADVLVELEPGVCDAQITYPEIIANACAVVSQTDGLGTDGLFPVGTTVETWKAIGLNGDSVLMSFNVVVISINIDPTIDSIANVVADENTPLINVPLSGISFGADCVDQEVTIAVISQNVDLVSAIAVNYTSPESTGSLDITLVEDSFGNDTISVIVSDSEGAEDTVEFELTVNPVNKQPTINAISDLEVDEDSPLVTIPLSGISYGNDLEMQDITVSATGINPELVSNISVNYTSPETTGSVELTIEPDKFGEETITINVMDDLGASVSESFMIKVTPVNDAPYLVMPLPDGNVNASYPYELSLTALMGVVFDDIDDEMLTFDLQEKGTDELPVWAEIESGLLTAVPMLADTGTYSFVVTATDVAGAMVADTFMLVVEGYPTGINDFDNNSFDVRMYPNPTNGIVNLKINSAEIMDSDVVVRSITGSEIFRKTYRASEEISFDLSEQVGGIYLIMVQQSDKNIIKKLILDRK